MHSLDAVLSTLAIVLLVSPITILLFLIALDLPRRWKTLRWRPFRLAVSALLLGVLAVGMHSHVQDVCANGPSSSTWFVIAVVWFGLASMLWERQKERLAGKQDEQPPTGSRSGLG
jgi:putative effector of murein hydrolase